MKKILFFILAIAGLTGLVKYMNKNGLPILGNYTMKMPIKTGIDPYDLLLKGIHFAESKNIVL